MMKRKRSDSPQPSCVSMKSDELEGLPSNFRELDLRHKKLRDSGVKLPSAGLENLHCMLEIPRVGHADAPSQQEKVIIHNGRRKKNFFLGVYLTNSLKYLNLNNREKSTKIVLCRSNREDISSDFYPVRNISHMVPEDLKNTFFKLVLQNIDNKQYAIASLRKKDGSFDVFGPFYPKNQNGIIIHSEQQIIKKIERKLRQNRMQDYSDMVIYSKKSPCLGREGMKTLYGNIPINPGLLTNILMRNKSYKKRHLFRKKKLCIKKSQVKKHKLPCMFALTRLSFILGRRYGIKVYIGFSEYYGCTGPITKVIKKHKNDKDNELHQELLKARERIVNVPDLQFSLSKEMISMRRVFNQVKENIPRTKRSEILGEFNKIMQKIVSGISDAPQTREYWEQFRTETAKKLHEEMMHVKTLHSESVCDGYKEEFLKIWSETLEESCEKCCDERLSDGINREAVLLFMKEVKVFKHHPVFFHYDHPESN